MTARRRGRWLAAGALLLAAAVVVAIVLVSGGGGETPPAPRSVIPPDDLLRNSSFEQSKPEWDSDEATLERLVASDAPDGRFVVRVTAATTPGKTYSINDTADKVEDVIKGQGYTAKAYVKGTTATDGQDACLTIRERPPVGAGGTDYRSSKRAVLSTAGYEPVVATHVVQESGNRVDAYVFGVDSDQEDDAFLVDAFSLVEGGTSSTGTPC